MKRTQAGRSESRQKYPGNRFQSTKDLRADGEIQYLGGQMYIKLERLSFRWFGHEERRLGDQCISRRTLRVELSLCQMSVLN